MAPEAATSVDWGANGSAGGEITDYRERSAATARYTVVRSVACTDDSQLSPSGRKEFPILVKADVQVLLKPSCRRWKKSAMMKSFWVVH